MICKLLPNVFTLNFFTIPIIAEHERGAEDNQLVPADSGRGGLPALLQRDEEGQQRQVDVRLQRRLILQE